MYQEKYKDCLDYIEQYWDVIAVDPKTARTNAHSIPIPHKYMVPNDRKFKYLFYWDTFFMFRGLLGSEKRVEILKSTVENFKYLFTHYGVIPNFNSYASIGRSQPPFLSTMIFDVYELTGDKKWLKESMDIAKLEYTTVWFDKDKAYNHKVPGYILSKYGDRDVGYAVASELESGWDFTSRFYNRCNEFFPVDLNCYLYKYERDFYRASELFGDKKEQEFWQERSEKRKSYIYKYCWNAEKNFFFDYDFIHKKQSEFYALSGFIPLWAGIVDAKDAKAMLVNLSKFETDFGLLITAKESLAPRLTFQDVPVDYEIAIQEQLTPKQWDYPHIWAPVEYLAVVGLLRYGLVDDAMRIMKKSLAAHAAIFEREGAFFEKMDGTTGGLAKNFHYPNQVGFGWTNAVFYRYVQLLDVIEKDGEKALYKQPMRENPPYQFSVAH
jgi:alpha,alpha-trehalase